jgi:hypothetical protein
MVREMEKSLLADTVMPGDVVGRRNWWGEGAPHTTLDWS